MKPFVFSLLFACLTLTAKADTIDLITAQGSVNLSNYDLPGITALDYNVSYDYDFTTATLSNLQYSFSGLSSFSFNPSFTYLDCAGFTDPQGDIFQIDFSADLSNLLDYCGNPNVIGSHDADDLIFQQGYWLGLPGLISNADIYGSGPVIVTAAPEPSTAMLLSFGLLGLKTLRYKRSRLQRINK